MTSTEDRFLCDCWPGRLMIVAAVLVLLLTGCNRSFYRQQADQDAYGLIERGSCDPRWPLEHYQIQPDPRSRFFDPDDPDRPPMPPDDPTAHQLMHCVDGMDGWKRWHCNGDTPYVENPNWRAYLPVDETGAVVFNRETVVELGLLHSREYQRQLELLYLSALDVSYEQFLFDARFFGGHTTFFTADGRLRGKTGAGPQVGASTSTLDVDQDLTMRRRLATGGELVAGVANSLMWQFSGDGSYGAFTLLDFSFVQPLLRGAGRAVALEDLTASERTLLANIRQMELFRRAFYGQIQVGLSSGFSLVRNGISLALPPTSSGVGGGFYGLLEQQVQIRNQQSNVDSLEDSLEMLQAAYDAGRIENRYQVDLARQALLSAQSRLLTLRATHESTLDNYKITLGLPPDVPVRIEDDLLKPFDLMAPAMLALREDVTRFRRCLLDESVPIPPDYRDQIVALVRRSAEQLAIVEKDIEALRAALPQRRKNLARLASRPEFLHGEIDPMVVDIEALNRRVELSCQEVAALATPLQATLAALEGYRPAEAAPLPDGSQHTDPARDEVLQDLIARLSDQLLELSVLQSLIRLDTVTINPVDLKSEQALAIAGRHRLDWMNARAALVDEWRQIELAADRLKAGLDVTVAGDLSTTDNHPLRFRGSTSRMRMGLEFDAPLTRLQERNNYREALINYQQARRNYYAFVDRINQNLRLALRQLQLTQLNFEVRRAAVLVAITKVDVARMRLLRPPKANETSAMGATVGRDLVTAVTDLLEAQNSFLGVWIDYEAYRMNLDFELGTMQLDGRGMWIDPGEMMAENYEALDEPEAVPPVPGDASEAIPLGAPPAPPPPGSEERLFPPPPLPKDPAESPAPAPPAPAPTLAGPTPEAGPAASLAALEAGCAQGVAADCLSLGELLFEGRAGLPARPEQARTVLAQACQLRSGPACTLLGYLLELGIGAAPDLAAARTRYRAGCDLGDGRGCSNLAALLERGGGGPADEAGARSLFLQGCERGDAEGGSAAGDLWVDGVGGPADAARARELFGRGCRAGSGAGCYGLALLWADGTGGPRDLDQARDFFQQACTSGDGRGCNDLGVIFVEGASGQPDPARAMALFEQGCTQEEGAACANLAFMRFAGEGGPRDEAAGRGLLQRACDLGDGEGCFELAEALRTGRGGKADAAGARAAMQRACEQGSAVACERVQDAAQQLRR